MPNNGTSAARERTKMVSIEMVWCAPDRRELALNVVFIRCVVFIPSRMLPHLFPLHPAAKSVSQEARVRIARDLAPFDLYVNALRYTHRLYL